MTAKYLMVRSSFYGCDSGCVGSDVEVLDENQNTLNNYFEFDAYYSEDKMEFINTRLEKHFSKHPEHSNLEVIYDLDLL